MRKAPIVLLSLLALLAVGITSSLSFAKENYKQVNAAASYKTFYLYVPNTVTRLDGSEGLVWDADDDNVKICDPINTLVSGYKMHKVKEHLYAYTLPTGSGQLQFTSVNSSEQVVFAFGDSDVPSISTIITQGYNYLELIYHRRSDHNASGNWGTHAVSTAEDFAKTFNTVVGDGTCALSGNTNQDQLSAVWGEMNTLYTGLSDIEKGRLTSITLESSEALQDFASLYDYILTKPSYSGIYSDFARRNPSLLGFKDMNYSVNNNSYSTLIAISVIGTLTLFAVPLYYVLRKKNKEN